MYSIEKTSYGFKIVQLGTFKIDEVQRYKSDVMAAFAEHAGPFSLLIDSRRLTLPTPEVLKVFDQLYDAVWKMGCERGAIIVESPVAKGMVIQACAKAQYPTNDRIIDARITENWEKVALAWIIDVVEPTPQLVVQQPSH